MAPLWKLHIIMLLLSTLLLEANTLPSKKCACWSGYKAQNLRGKTLCAGEQISHVMPCNVPQPPKCMCHGHDGILKDRSGTWCTIYRNGVELRRWTCENSKQWNEFLVKYKRYVRRRNDNRRVP